MDAPSGHTPADLTTLLRERARHMTLGQALRLLERAHADAGDSQPPFARNVLVRPHLSLGFPAADITDVQAPDAPDSPPPAWRLTTTLLGLYGTMGPLPTFYTEELLEEARNDDSLTRDFLDIINNHFYHLLYDAERQNRLPRRLLESGDSRAAHLLFCLTGHPDHDDGLPPVALTELFVCRNRSALRLQRSLGYLLQRRDVRVEECVERRVAIAPAQHCRLGAGNATLGEDAVIGSEVRDSTGRFRIHLDAVHPDDIVDFLHDGAWYARIRAHVREFVQHSLEFDLVLHPTSAPARPTALGLNSRPGFYLGSTAKRADVVIHWRATEENAAPRRI